MDLQQLLISRKITYLMFDLSISYQEVQIDLTWLTYLIKSSPSIAHLSNKRLKQAYFKPVYVSCSSNFNVLVNFPFSFDLKIIKMSGTENNQNTEAAVQSNVCVNMESVNRITKLPVVESTIQTATSIYEKVKDYNAVTNWTLSTAESTVNKAIEVGKPIAAPVVCHLENHIKKVDGMLCTGLDYVETKIPAVKLPPGEMYNNTKEYVSNTVTPAVQSARAVVEPAVQTARGVVEPAVQAAKNAVEPAVQSARQIAEPLVQPAMEKAQALKDYGTQKVGEFLHLTQEHDPAKPAMECAECIEHVEKKEKQKAAAKIE